MNMKFDLSNDVLSKFIEWLDGFGEYSQDHQDFYGSKIGAQAKELYYRFPRAGLIAVAPMVFCEAFLPSARKYFFQKTRLPIADAHYAMGLALLYSITKNEAYYQRAVHFLEILKQARCPGYDYSGWGYPFDWHTRNGTIPAGTPLITTVPYCYEAFEYVYRIDGRQEWLDILRSIADHALLDYKDIKIDAQAYSCTYTPYDGEGVVNASAYRAFLLISAWKAFDDQKYKDAAIRNLNFVIGCQNPDGSWPYSIDNIRDFVDHFHTCFVLKALVKIEKLTPIEGLSSVIEKGIDYYLENLFDHDRLPKPFSKAPRLTIYKRELYDCAECLNLGALLRGRFTKLDQAVDHLLQDILTHWRKPDGSFRSRMLLAGWDNVPMHRWGQSEIFRSMCLMAAMNEEIEAV